MKTGLVFGSMTVVAIVFALLWSPPVTFSQQTAPNDYLWSVVPNGVFADVRMRDALGHVIDSQAVARDAGIAGTLGSTGSDVNGPQTATPLDKAKLLMRASGYDDPATQLREVRRCRVWMPAPYLNSQEQLPLSASLGRALARAVADLGISIQPCELVDSLAEADIVLWPALEQPPVPLGFQAQPRGEVPSFIVEVDRLASPARPVSPPVTGDGGLATTN